MPASRADLLRPLPSLTEVRNRTPAADEVLRCMSNHLCEQGVASTDRTWGTNATTYICLNLSLENRSTRPPTSPAHLWASESSKHQSASCGCPQISRANALRYLGLAQWGQR